MVPRPDHGEQSYKGFGRLVGRHALITGGDSGIGRAVAIAFAREGAAVAINYLGSEEADAESTLRIMKDAGVEAVALPGDICDEAFCTELVHDASKQLGGLDILVNVAGKQTAVKDIADLTTEQFELTFRTNVFAMFWLCKAALPLMPRGATIINTTSIQSYSRSPMLLDYAPPRRQLRLHARTRQAGDWARHSGECGRARPFLDALAIIWWPACQEHSRFRRGSADEAAGTTGGMCTGLRAAGVARIELRHG